MPFSPPRILTDSEANTIRGKCLMGHATKEEQMQLISHFDLVEMGLRSALERLSGCLPGKIYVYGAYGERWSEAEPDDDIEYEEINFKKILGEE